MARTAGRLKNSALVIGSISPLLFARSRATFAGLRARAMVLSPMHLAWPGGQADLVDFIARNSKLDFVALLWPRSVSTNLFGS